VDRAELELKAGLQPRLGAAPVLSGSQLVGRKRTAVADDGSRPSDLDTWTRPSIRLGSRGSGREPKAGVPQNRLIQGLGGPASAGLDLEGGMQRDGVESGGMASAMYTSQYHRVRSFATRGSARPLSEAAGELRWKPRWRSNPLWTTLRVTVRRPAWHVGT
jgi:hypothetical protein